MQDDDNVNDTQDDDVESDELPTLPLEEDEDGTITEVDETEED